MSSAKPNYYKVGHPKQQSGSSSGHPGQPGCLDVDHVLNINSLYVTTNYIFIFIKGYDSYKIRVIFSRNGYRFDRAKSAWCIRYTHDELVKAVTMVNIYYGTDFRHARIKQTVMPGLNSSGRSIDKRFKIEKHKEWHDDLMAKHYRFRGHALCKCRDQEEPYVCAFCQVGCCGEAVLWPFEEGGVHLYLNTNCHVHGQQYMGTDE